VLAVAPTVTYAKRLLEYVTVLEADLRVQVLWTAPPHALGGGVLPYLHHLGGVVVPWAEAMENRYDLALAAGPGGVDRLRAPVVMVPHGANFVKQAAGTDGVAYGLRRADLVPDGRTPPAAVVLAHENDLHALARSCPEVLPVASVVGDPAHDRIVASRARRAAYRQALGLRDGERLVSLVSTWGPHSSFARFEALLPWLMNELRELGHRAVLLAHPNAWARHGSRQVRAWLARASAQGLGIVAPESEWRSALLASDWIVGDHGSVTLYGTLTGAPLLLVSAADQEINPASPAAELALRAPTLTPAHRLGDQLAYASAEYRPEDYAAIAARITSAPGLFHRDVRALLYRLLRLGRPAHPVQVPPLPALRGSEVWATQDVTEDESGRAS
jgi:hypothetical protein